jgi:hypothetical protein
MISAMGNPAPSDGITYLFRGIEIRLDETIPRDEVRIVERTNDPGKEPRMIRIVNSKEP